MNVLIRQKKLLHIAGICGICSPIVLFFCLGAAISSSASWFSWTDNWLSELGGSFGQTSIWAARGLTSVLFNSGMILAGTGGIIFALSLKKSGLFSTILGKIGTLMLFGNMTALCGIGVFPVTLGKIHAWSSIAFFCSIPIVFFLMSFELQKLFGKKWWWMIHILCVFTLCSVSAFLFFPNLYGCSKAIAEMIMLCSVFSFCITVSAKVLTMKNSDFISMSSVSSIGRRDILSTLSGVSYFFKKSFKRIK